MNKEHTKDINEAYGHLELALGLVQSVKDEQQETFDAKSEKWQESDAGQTYSEGLDALQTILDGIENAMADMSNSMEEV